MKRVWGLLLAVVVAVGILPANTQAAVGSEKAVILTEAYTFTSGDRLENTDYCGRIFPVTVSSGGTIVVTVNAEVLQKDVVMRLYTDAQCTHSIGYLEAPQKGRTYTKDSIRVSAAGTYYLSVASYADEDASFINTLTMDVEFYASSELTLMPNQWYALGNTADAKYYKITVPALLNLTLYGNTELDYDICKSNKAVLYAYQRLQQKYGFRASYRLAKGTYYIKMKESHPPYDFYKIKYTLTADSTLKNGSFSTIYPGDARNATYLKLRSTADGYITVTLYKGADYDDSAYLTLLDAGGRAISDAMWLYLPGRSSGKAMFGVKKNTTYYVKAASLEGKAAIRYVQTKVAEKSGTTRSKAVTVKKHKTIKGSIPAGSSQADWYRVKLTGKQKIKVSVSADASGSIRMQLYDAKGKKLGGYRVLSGGGSKKQTITSKSARKAGTYYIRIYRGSSKSSGHYTLKWG